MTVEEAAASDRPPAALARRLHEALLDVLVGQERAALGVCLALIAREHAYLEGPPGCGKSRLVAAAAALSGARSHVVVCHRDLRESELLGDSVLRRGTLGRSERLELERIPGPLLSAEVALLEDLSRAPGEALGPLLWILGRRRALGRPLPLESALATAPAEETSEIADAATTEPLEPAQLDRFAVQLRLRGMVQSRRWRAARRILDGMPALDEDAAIEAVLDQGERQQLQDACASIAVTDAAREALDRLARGLARRARESPGLLSDRSLTARLLALARAHALLRGAAVVEAEDLVVIHLMVARRLPSASADQIDEVLEEALEESVQVAARGVRLLAAPALSGEMEATATPRTGAVLESEELPFEVEEERLGSTEPAGVDRLLRALDGRIERGRLRPDSDLGGQPRRYRPLRSLDEILDGDPIETLLFVEGRLPGLPRTWDRQRRNAGGALVVLRDVSASMAGSLAEWASRVVTGVVRMAARRRMRVGYVEFHHKAIAHEVGGRLLHRSYARLGDLARTTRTLGQTNYEAPLRRALEGLQGGGGRNRHIVMLTDGLPILGDPSVRRERALARRLGVSLHTVFLGAGECPAVLDQLSTETDGLRFRAVPDERGRLEVRERD